MKMNNRPIGVFDSGVGGLTVLKEYIKLFPNEDFIYYGDTAHLPYGDKSKEKIIEYSEKVVDFLISKNVKLIIIACGTASANAYEYLKAKYINVEIRNIIEPVAKKISDKQIGVIATKATIKSNTWENEIHKYNKDAIIYSLACPLFVPLIEEGFIQNKSSDYIVEEYMKNFRDKNITSLILRLHSLSNIKRKDTKSIG